ncbi:glycosyltransferase family 4 protein [soil metagenome]
MKVGIVCPYALDVPGGVQQHVLELADALLGLGLQVSVLAPVESATPQPPHVVAVPGAVAVPYNGSVARLSFGPTAVRRVRRWLAEEQPDVLHVHEPAVPSLSLLALRSAEVPVVATFHASMTDSSRALAAVAPVLRPALERISARVAVSQAALGTMQRHVGGAGIVIPNGLRVSRFAAARAEPRWSAAAGGAVVFLGRMDEPRKGLGVLLDAWPQVSAARPDARLLVAGHGDAARVRARVVAGLDAATAGTVEVVGPVAAPDKGRLLASADVFVAPHTGGESFGMVLVEAIAAGAPVLASDLPAFVDVLQGGRVGRLFAVADAAALATGVIDLLDDPVGRSATARRAARAVQAYDWSVVARRVLRVYEAVAGSGRVAARRRNPGSAVLGDGRVSS